MSTAPLQFGLVIHATHEAGVKVGGIGAVFDGLLATQTYNERIARTILVGPMETDDGEQMSRLVAPRNRLQILYSSYHGVDEVNSILSTRLRAIERLHLVKILYGTRAFGSTRHEVVLVDARHANTERTNSYKASLYGHFGIESDRYEHNPEYSLYINAAEPGYRALQAVAPETDGIIIAHEFMGMPLCYSAMMHAPGRYRTIFYGHEVATVRPLVESHPGHDTMFYNVLAQAQSAGHYLKDIFGDQSHFFKHALIRPAASHCDNIFAVGDWVLEEMRFLGPDWESANIDLVYNGVPSHEITPEQKRTSHARLQQYCANLLGYRPDYVLTHVTRFIPSKGLWRDIGVMEHLSSLLSERAQRAVLFVLSTIVPVGRSPKAVRAMEAQYGWPVHHRETSMHVDGQSVPDLISHEIPFYRAVERFNRTASGSAIVLVNQFGWSRDRCGERMPKEMTFMDIRQGSDLEFGQSIYEPFGIAQLEPLCVGALCVVSSICGCLGFARQTGGLDKPNIIVADYTDAGALGGSIETALSIDQEKRDEIESEQARVIAHQIIERLPTDDATAQKMLAQGYESSQKMSWEVVARDYLLPGLRHVVQR